MYHYSNRRAIPLKATVPVFAIALMLLSGGGNPAFASNHNTPIVPPGTTVALSPLAVAVNNANAALVEAKIKVTIAEKASLTAPTDATLKANLLTAISNVTAAKVALKVAEKAYFDDRKETKDSAKTNMELAQKNLQNAREAFKTLKHSLDPVLEMEIKTAIEKAKVGAGSTTVDLVAIAKAKELVASTSATYIETNAKFVVAEKASQTALTNVVLLASLDVTRAAVITAEKAFKAAKDTLELLMQRDKPRTEIDITLRKSIEASFLLAHPELSLAQKAVDDAEIALTLAKEAFHAVNDLGKKDEPKKDEPRKDKNDVKVDGKKDVKVEHKSEVKTSAKTNVELAQKNLQNAREAFKTIRNDLAPALEMEIKTAIEKAKIGAGSTTVDLVAITKAKELVASTSVTYIEANAKFVVAEKASKATPNDVVLLASLDVARAAVITAEKALKAAKNALELLMQRDKPRTEIDITLRKSIEASFLLAHPELSLAQKAVDDAEIALTLAKEAFHAVNDLGKKDEPKRDVKPTITTGSLKP